jgi:hypothetical protein
VFKGGIYEVLWVSLVHGVAVLVTAQLEIVVYELMGGEFEGQLIDS